MVKYFVQKIVNVRSVKKKREYQVKWKNYSNKHNTWEPMHRLIEDGQERFIHEYEKQMKTIWKSIVSWKYIKIYEKPATSKNI